MQERITPTQITVGSTQFDFSRTYVMGILNVTPDSFSDGGDFIDPEVAVARALAIEAEGADIIDIGGESTRPGAQQVSLEEELRRTIPVIEKLRGVSDIPISIDTYKSDVAKAAVESGANLVNDISGLRFDPMMAETVASFDVPVVIMHIKGEPRSMQQNPTYEHLMAEIIGYLEQSLGIAERAGIAGDKTIVDPGMGFGKTFKHNFCILRDLNELNKLGRPILVGVSRKSFLGSISGTDPKLRLEESLAAAVLAAQNGAHIIRAHDVAATVRALKVLDITRKPDSTS